MKLKPPIPGIGQVWQTYPETAPQRTLLFLPGGITDSYVEALRENCACRDISMQELLSEEEFSPGVLLLEAVEPGLSAALQCASRNRQLEVVALAEAARIPSLSDGRLYACLPTDIHTAVLGVTLRNAFDHIALRCEWDESVSSLEMLAAELQELNRIGTMLSAERDTGALLDLILGKAREITHSDAGSLYLVEEGEDGEKRVRFKLTQNDSIEVPFRESVLPLNHESLAGHVALTGDIQNIKDAYALPPDSPFHINQSFDRQIGYRSKSMLAVPMRTPLGEIIGVFQLINCKADPEGRFGSPEQIEREALPFPKRYQELAASLASQAAVALENSRMTESIQNLFEGFVRASVTAIESRDPSTAGHSFRVADMTVALAEAADRDQAGPCRQYHFSSQQLKELRYASILHDFGKVGVREQVLAKAKKLYPSQLEIIRMRADLIRVNVQLRSSLRRIDFLLSNGSEDYESFAAAEERETVQRLQDIEKCMQTVLSANEPRPIRQDTAASVEAIALRTFEDHLGNKQSLITPEEAALLSIPKGNLTEEEKEHVNSHVVHSHKFLSEIPWTKELKRVPEIAGAHHERLDGTGYPHNLSANRIPVESRIMMIADVFDAVTAADRPYKKALPVEAALQILRSDEKAGAIDGDLLDLFIRTRPFVRG